MRDFISQNKAKKSNASKAIRNLARQKGVSVGEVRREIEYAIERGMANSDPEIQAYWARIPKKGEKPTPEAVIAYMAVEAKRRV